MARLERYVAAATFSQDLSTHTAVILLRVRYRAEIKEDPHVSPGPGFPPLPHRPLDMATLNRRPAAGSGAPQGHLLPTGMVAATVCLDAISEAVAKARNACVGLP